MKNIQLIQFVLLFIALTVPRVGSSQANLDFELTYEINRIYPYILMNKKELNDANTLSEINTHYKSSWIREYVSVEILTSYKGETRKAVSKNDTLTQEQKDIMNMAATGADISVRVQYIPENTLTHNDIKEIKFSFVIEPEKEARFPGGEQQMLQYLQENAANKIADTKFKKYNLTAVKFTVDEEGQVVDTHVFESSKDEATDEILLAAICNMPNWEPAEYANGIKVKQEFVLTAGDMTSCVINLIQMSQN